MITFDEGEIGVGYVPKDVTADEVKEGDVKSKEDEVIAEESTPVEPEKMDVESVSSNLEGEAEEIRKFDDTIELGSSEAESAAEEKPAKTPKLDETVELDATIEYTLPSVNYDPPGAKNDEAKEPAILENYSKDTTPKKKMENENSTTPTKLTCGTLEKNPFKTPERIVRETQISTSGSSDDACDLNNSQESNVSELSKYSYVYSRKSS